MGGTTVPLGFPYPTGGDLLSGGDNAIQALADAVDDYFVGANTTVTPGANITLGSTAVYRRGNMGLLVVNNLTTGAVINAGSTILTVPAGYRPPVTWYGTVYNQSTIAGIAVAMTSAGVFQGLFNISAANALFGSFLYPL